MISTILRGNSMLIEIYGTIWCNYCQQAKKLCEANEYNFTYTDVDDTASLKLLESRLGYKIKSVPQIFLDGNHLANGFTGLKQELAKLKN